MQERDAFSGCHPLIGFSYFGLVLLFTMFLMNPVSLAASLCGALCYAVRLNGRRATALGLRALAPAILLAAAVNPAFNHKGATLLAYLPSGNPLTLESVVYGLAAALMVAAAVTWFSCCAAVMTSDKIVCLLGRAAPALALVLSMTLRFVPRFKARLHAVAEAQRGIGRDVSAGSPLRRMKNAVTIFSIVVTWSLESAVETADSMKSRGCGLPGRTAFSIYRFDGRDRTVLLWLGFCAAFLLGGWASGGFYWRCYPTVRWAAATPFTVSLQLVYLMLCMTPVIFDRWEEKKWKNIRSAI